MGVPTIGIGKIDDLFAGRGLSVSIHTDDNIDGMNKTTAALDAHATGLIFTNLVEFDMVWGHRNDPRGFARALAQFDRQLGAFLLRLRDEDVLFIVADHGVDPTTPSTDHSRELIPLLVFGRGLRSGVNLGVRETFGDLALTLAEMFSVPHAPCAHSSGRSFWPQVCPLEHS
jgi:phosphopentomutase